MGPVYDKQIDSKFADMKNTGGREGARSAPRNSSSASSRTPWAHLDIAGTGMGSSTGDLNQSWGSGFGVRLLDRLVAIITKTDVFDSFRESLALARRASKDARLKTGFWSRSLLLASLPPCRRG